MPSKCKRVQAQVLSSGTENACDVRAGWAFTLIEMVVSLGVLGLIVVASGSLVVLGIRTVPDDGDATSETGVAASALVQLGQDLSMATGVTAGTATAVVFTIPDRTGDAVAETVKYAWSGVTGEPLTRSLNGGAANVVAPDVGQFELRYVLATGSESVRADPVVGAETRLASHTSLTVSLYSLNEDEWGAQFFRPALPADAVSWSVTRVRVKLQRALVLGGPILFAMRLADADGQPVGSALATGQVNGGLLSLTPTIYSISGLTALRLAPAQGVCVVVYSDRASSPGYACLIDSKAAVPGQAWLESDDGGRSWTADATRVLQFTLDAEVTTASVTDVEHRFLRAVDVVLGAGDGDAPALRARITVVNLPEAP